MQLCLLTERASLNGEPESFAAKLLQNDVPGALARRAEPHERGDFRKYRPFALVLPSRSEPAGRENSQYIYLAPQVCSSTNTLLSFLNLWTARSGDSKRWDADKEHSIKQLLGCVPEAAFEESEI